MNERHIKAFNSIVYLVQELYKIYGEEKGGKILKITPLALYNRLVINNKFTDDAGMMRVINGFEIFINKYKASLINNGNVPIDERIYYGKSKKAYIEIGKFMTGNLRPCILEHLLTIAAILDPDDEVCNKLSSIEEERESSIVVHSTPLGVDNSTEEGKFISDIMHNIHGKVSNIVSESGTSNPLGLVMGLVQSGAIMDFMSGMQQGVESGRMDPKKLLSSMYSMMDSMRDNIKIEEVHE